MARIEGHKLSPANGAWVCRIGSEGTGVVQRSRENSTGCEVLVHWLKTGERAWHSPSQLTSAYRPGMVVQESGTSTRKSLGEGCVVATRTLGRRDQVLVEFFDTGSRAWLPYENLRRIKDPEGMMAVGDLEREGAERFRLRNLAHALELWNASTGSLSKLEVDPLPHQIHLVHHILASGNLNWLIGDDVGLGKTIEVGMLMSALAQRGSLRRVLIVTPAGLVRQWQEELHHKFGMDDYLIYGSDFRINDLRHWGMYDHVIGSIDRLKLEPNMDLLVQAPEWDLIVFDEAHRLSRRQWGMRFDASDRFRLAAALRRRTRSMILLSGTPHQGMPDKFEALLELLRPELKQQIHTLALNPEILKEMVIRNHKADATDAEGRFMFHGTVTRSIQVPSAEDYEAFDRKLTTYLRRGYDISKQLGQKGRAIGFVMTVYRKLAASSIAAIQVALERRLQKLRADAGSVLVWQDWEPDDERFTGEFEEREADRAQQFFAGEEGMVEELIQLAGQLRNKDLKLKAFLDHVVSGVQAQESENKLLIFTEYRSTQDYLKQALESRFGTNSVHLINGGQSFQEREGAISDWEASGRFLVSTEAGGEGLNLHRDCHVLVNYDLPWNPMRIAQRIGRIYRYGQTKRVVVLNLVAPHTFDSRIRNHMQDRILQVVRELSSVSREFREGFEEEILGELAEMLDVEAIMEEALVEGVERTRQRVDDALKRAREAVQMQEELFEYAAGFDPEETKERLPVDKNHAKAFVCGILEVLDITIADTSHGGQVLELRLPEEIHTRDRRFRQRMRIAFERQLAERARDIELMDFGSPFFRFLIDLAKTHRFRGICASIGGMEAEAVMTAMLRWQDDRGRRVREEFVALLLDGDGAVRKNPQEFSDWLLTPAGSSAGGQTTGRGSHLVQDACEGADAILSAASNAYLHPEGRQFLSAAAIHGDSSGE